MNLYKRRFPTRSFDEHVIDVLRLSPAEYANVQAVAGHWLGAHFHDSIPVHPPSKLLPSSLRTIRDTDQQTLAALMHVEKSAHEDHRANYHMGGGLWETGRSILSTLWGATLGPTVNSLFEKIGFKKKPTPLSNQERKYADLVGQAYQDKSSRANSLAMMGTRQAQYDTEKFTVFEDERNKRVHIGVRGTLMNLKDLGSDLHILAGNTSGHEKELAQELKDVLANYSDEGWIFDVSGHSLGATELMNIFQNTDDPLLKRVDRVNLYNPGLTPTHNLDTPKAAVNDPRFHFYLNDADLLSNTMVSLIHSSTPVKWGKTGHNPLSNHGLGQWEDV